MKIIESHFYFIHGNVAFLLAHVVQYSNQEKNIQWHYLKEYIVHAFEVT